MSASGRKQTLETAVLHGAYARISPAMSATSDFPDRHPCGCGGPLPPRTIGVPAFAATTGWRCAARVRVGSLRLLRFAAVPSRACALRAQLWQLPRRHGPLRTALLGLAERPR